MEFGKLLDFFKGVPKWALTVSFLLLTISATVFIMLKALGNIKIEESPIKELTESQKTIKAKTDYDIAQKLDSITKKNHEANLARLRQNKDDIKEECIRLKYEMYRCNHVTYWKIHNNGNIIEEGDTDRPYFMVLISSSRDIKFDFQESQKLHGGYFNFAKSVKNNGWYVVGDVAKFPSINYGESRQLMSLHQTKSIFGSLVKKTPYEWYFVSFSFSRTIKPEESSEILQRLIDFDRFVKRRMD